MFDKNNFYKSDSACNFIYSQINNNSVSNSVSDSLNSNYITGCDRKIFYQITGENSEKSFMNQKSRLFLIKKWVSIFEKIKSFEVLDYNKIFADQNYNIHSEIDIVGKMAGFPTILVIKKVQDFHEPKRKEIVDAITKMWLSEVNDCFIIYDNIVSDEYRVLRVIPNEVLLNGIKNKLKKIKFNKLSGKTPDRKYDSYESIECKKCDFKKKCWRL